MAAPNRLTKKVRMVPPRFGVESLFCVRNTIARIMPVVDVVNDSTDFFRRLGFQCSRKGGNMNRFQKTEDEFEFPSDSRNRGLLEEICYLVLSA